MTITLKLNPEQQRILDRICKIFACTPDQAVTHLVGIGMGHWLKRHGIAEVI